MMGSAFASVLAGVVLLAFVISHTTAAFHEQVRASTETARLFLSHHLPCESADCTQELVFQMSILVSVAMLPRTDK